MRIFGEEMGNRCALSFKLYFYLQDDSFEKRWDTGSAMLWVLNEGSLGKRWVFRICHATTRLTKKNRTFDCRFLQFHLIENLKTTWDLERNFQGASFEPNRIFLALFVWEILKDKVKNCKFGFRSKIHFHLFSLLIVKKTFVFVHA